MKTIFRNDTDRAIQVALIADEALTVQVGEHDPQLIRGGTLHVAPGETVRVDGKAKVEAL